MRRAAVAAAVLALAAPAASFAASAGDEQYFDPTQDAQQGEECGEQYSSPPQHDDHDADGRHRERDAHQQVARHQAVTLPNRRSRRW